MLALACAKGEPKAAAGTTASADSSAAAATAVAPDAANAALGDSLPSSRSFSAIMSGFEMRIPDLWGQRYMATERRDPEEFPGAVTVTEFVFLGMSGGVPPSILGLVRYPRATYDGLATKPGPVVASIGSDVIAVQQPSANPYPAGSDDARAFDGMRITAKQVEGLVRVR